MTRAYLRLDPKFWERKRVEQGYPAGAVSALVGVFCLAEHQPERGRFRNERVLRALLEDDAKWLPYLRDRHDIVVRPDGQVYADGWEEWQEGDWKVGERVKRIRGRKVTPATDTHVTPATVSSVTVPTVTSGTVPAVALLLESVIDGAGGGAGGREKKATQPPQTRQTAEQPRLTKAQLDAWRSFEAPEWTPFVAAWQGRGLLHPPSGAVGEDGSQRALLWEIALDRPSSLGEWVTEAKGRTARQVIDHVLGRWHDVKAEAERVDASSAKPHRNGSSSMTSLRDAIEGGDFTGDDDVVDFTAAAR